MRLNIWAQPLIKKHAARELWNFKVREILFLKENVKAFTNWKSKIHYQQINFVKNIKEVEVLFWNFGISSGIVKLLWR